LPRLTTAFPYNAGHLTLLAYLQGRDLEESATLLQQADRLFIQGRNASLVSPRTNWRLSFIAFEQERFDDATDLFLLARQTELPDFLLAEHSDGFFVSYQYHILNALATERYASPVDAIQVYRDALAIEPKELPEELYRRYYGLLTESEDLKLRSVGQRLQNLGDEKEPSDRVVEQSMTPFLPVLTDNEPIGCWELTQIRYDRLALEIGPLVPVQLYWRHIFEPSQSYTETVTIVNLAPNAGFEWGIQNGQPIGYPNTIYIEDNPYQVHQLIKTEILSQPTTVAGLLNSTQYYNSSYVSNLIMIDSGQLYFQGGWTKSVEGNASLGQSWLNIADSENQEKKFQYVASSIQNQDWNFYGRVMMIPTFTESVNLWLLNFNANGQVYFDDILFFKINYPSC
jgi:hypothetical protein